MIHYQTLKNKRYITVFTCFIPPTTNHLYFTLCTLYSSKLEKKLLMVRPTLGFYCMHNYREIHIYPPRTALVHFNFRAGSTFPVPVCTVPHHPLLNLTFLSVRVLQISAVTHRKLSWVWQGHMG